MEAIEVRIRINDEEINHELDSRGSAIRGRIIINIC